MINLAIFSDVHANLEALNVVHDAISDLSPDIAIYLGDTIGYGPNPKECIEIVENMAQIHVVGNHDYALFRNNFMYFNPLPKLSLLWTKELLSEQEIQQLGSHPFFSIFPLLFLKEMQCLFMDHQGNR